MKTILLTVVSLFVICTSSLACNCLILTEFGQIIDDNDQIFIGTVVKKSTSESPVKFEFKVEREWKGDLKSTTTISTSTGDCAVDFLVGETYIVYAKKFSTTICRRSALLNSSFDDKVLDYYFKGIEIGKKLLETDMEIISRKLMSEDLKSNYIVMTNYRVLSPKEIYKLHPKAFDDKRMTMFILEEDEKELVGTCVDKIIMLGANYPKKGWSRKKVMINVKRKKVCLE